MSNNNNCVKSEIKCYKHGTYKGLKPPIESNCVECWLVWTNKNSEKAGKILAKEIDLSLYSKICINITEIRKIIAKNISEKIKNDECFARETAYNLSFICRDISNLY